MARQKEFDIERVLDKAVDVFWQRGYFATSVQDLVDTLGIGRGSLYDTFGDKRCLYLAALDRYQARSEAQLHALLQQPGPVRPIITEWLHTLVAQTRDEASPSGCFMVNSAVECATHDAAIARRVEAAVWGMEAALVDLLVRAQQQGELAAQHNPQQIARVMVTTVLGLKVMARTNPAPDVAQDVIAGVLALLD